MKAIVRIAWIAGLTAILACVAAFTWRELRGDEPRTIVLVARNMAFEREDQAGSLNPSLAVRGGERLRLVIRNQDPGMKHDLTIAALGLQTRTLDVGESDELVFVIPDRPAPIDYTCSFHAVLMRGSLTPATSARASR